MTDAKTPATHRLDEYWARRYERSGGVLDALRLVSAVYQILFVNSYVDDYAIGVLDELAADPAVYRHLAKVAIKSAIRSIEAYQQELYRRLGRLDGAELTEANTCLLSAFEADMAKMTARMYESVGAISHRCTLSDRQVVGINLAFTLAKFANINLDGLVEKTRRDNPIVRQVVWTRHTELERRLYGLAGLLRVPSLLEDVRVYAAFCKFCKKWYQPDLYAKALAGGDARSDRGLHAIMAAAGLQ